MATPYGMSPADYLHRAGKALEARIDKEICLAMNPTYKADTATTSNTVADDPISPNHYSRFKVQPREYIEKNKLDFFTGNVIKYVTRAPHAGKTLTDLKKARSNINDLIRVEEERLAEVERNRPLTFSEVYARMKLDMPDIFISPPPKPVYFKHLYPRAAVDYRYSPDFLAS